VPEPAPRPRDGAPVPTNEDPAILRLMEAPAAEQLPALAAMGWPATSLLILMSACDGRCFFCARETVLSPPPELITPWPRVRAWLEAARPVPATRLCLGGTEPASHPAFEDTLRLAQEVGYREVELMSSGRRLAQPGVAERWAALGVRAVCAPLYSADAAAHDAVVGVPGHHAEVVAGLDRARAAGIRPRVHSLALTATLGGLRALADLCLDRWGSPLALAPLREKPDLFRYAEHAPAPEALEAALRGAPLGLVGSPACFAPGAPRGAPALISLYFRSQATTFAAPCASCASRPSCPGVVPAALATFGDGWLRPR
jgi:hypothetical protein